MSLAGGALTRELTRALTVALGSALGHTASQHALRSAVDTAQVLGLNGLERLLSALMPMAGRPWPDHAAPAVERIRVLAAECEAVATTEPIQRAEDELIAIAKNVAAQEAGGADPAPSDPGTAPTLKLSEVLEDLSLADDGSRERARDVRVSAPVAAALRAALDWLEEEGPSPRPLRIVADGSVLDVILGPVHQAGLQAAEKVLSVIGGTLFPATVLGPSVHPAGAWIVRVPSLSGRNSHLMLVQGGISIALPWHSVLRFYMVPAVELAAGTAGLGAPMLEPLTPLSKTRGEHPVVLIGHGLKRAYLVADQLVWRLEATPHPTDEPAPVSRVSRAVATADGTLYWVLDPSVALADVEAPLIAPESRTRPAEAEPLPVLGRADVEPLEAEAPTLEPSQRPAGSSPDPAPAIRELPATETATPVAMPALAALSEEEDATETPGPAVRTRPHRALIAEDSIAARVFLTRLLEREGFTVRAVTTATELFDELVDDTWSLVCIDVELPDARDEDVLGGVVATLGERAPATPIVALVRDAADVATAKSFGVSLTLRKPFEREPLRALLESLGLEAETGR